MKPPPFIGEQVEHASKLYTVTDRKACGVAGWWLTLSDGVTQPFGVLDRSVMRASPPILDNVVPIRRKWVPVVYEGGMAK